MALGPTEVTIYSPEVLKVVDGPGNNCTKAVWYDILLPLTALNTTRDKPIHDQRRRVWNQGFTKKGQYLSCSVSETEYLHSSD